MCDIRGRRIPNILTGPLLLSGIAWALWVGEAAGLADAAVGCLALAAPYVLLFLYGGGAGDAKLMGAIGAWLGIINGLIVLAVVSVVTICLAFAHALGKKQTRSLLATVLGLIWRVVFAVTARQKLSSAMEGLPDRREMQKMPYGVVILVGVLLAALGTVLWRTIADT